MSTFNPDSIQTGDGNLAEPVHVGRPGQQVIFSSVDPANSYAAKYPTIESVPADFNGTVDIVTPTYRATVKGDGTTKITTGYSDSIADRPSAALLGKGTWQDGNNIYTSNGELYKASPSLYYTNTSGFLVPSLAAANASTYSQSGNVITVINGGGTPIAHNIPDVINNGYYVYLAMGVAATGETIPAGWFSNFTYVDANTFTCVSSTSQTGTGAVNTQLTGVVLTPNTISVSGGLIGKNGSFDIAETTRCNNSAGSKIVRVTFGGISIISQQQTSIVFSQATSTVWNLNSESVQGFSLGSTIMGVNTAADFSITQSITVAAANDYMALVGLRMIIYPS